MDSNTVVMFVERAWPEFNKFNKKQCIIFLNFLNSACVPSSLITIKIGNHTSMTYFRCMITTFSYLSRNANIPMSINAVMLSCAIFNWYNNNSSTLMPYVPNIMSTCVLTRFLDNKLSKNVSSLIFSFVYDNDTYFDNRNYRSVYKFNAHIQSMTNLDILLLQSRENELDVSVIMDRYFHMYDCKMISDEVEIIKNNINIVGTVNVFELLRTPKINTIYTWRSRINMLHSVEMLYSSLKSFGF
jgi:hypothetical protein